MPWFKKLQNIVLLMQLIIYTETGLAQYCSRAGSRLVRQVLEKNFHPIIEYYGLNISENCPLEKSRDLYFNQEQYKLFEHNAKWSCELCGKAFYTQEFIDLHMENKHMDYLTQDSPVCLADYCQLFRCESFETRENHFWKKALCNKQNMKHLEMKCINLIQACIPAKSTVHKQAYDDIIEETCLLINCQDYWRPLHYELSPLEVLYYIVVTPILISILSIYYYHAFEHYYLNETHDSTNESKEEQYHSDHIIQSSVRNRFGRSRFQY